MKDDQNESGKVCLNLFISTAVAVGVMTCVTLIKSWGTRGSSWVTFKIT